MGAVFVDTIIVFSDICVILNHFFCLTKSGYLIEATKTAMIQYIYPLQTFML